MASRLQILSLKLWPAPRTSPSLKIHIIITKRLIIYLSLSASSLKILQLNFLHLMSFIFKDSLFCALSKGLCQLSPLIKPSKRCLMLSIWGSRKCRFLLANFSLAKPKKGNFFPMNFSPNSIFSKKKKSMTEFSYWGYGKSMN